MKGLKLSKGLIATLTIITSSFAPLENVTGQEDISIAPDYQSSGVDTESYNLVWQDEFEGNSLNRDNWNVELHQPGWVNAEWQEYIDDIKVLDVKDGALQIYPVKEGENYYSGRINTQNLNNFKYGFFEARIRVPKGQGFLPAFWLMSADEGLYGQWPRSGEIDIMEIHGSDTSKSFGTLHFGEPHQQSQGEFQLEEEDFSEDYHTFAVEWLPGLIKWFVDGREIHRENDWFTQTLGQGKITYPAPFDSEFYIILNLAIGGSWVGYPDASTVFENQAMSVDYVRVYQKSEYDENVSRPETEVTLRLPDGDGNYVINPDFEELEDFTDNKDWIFLTAEGGEALLTQDETGLVIQTKQAGSVDYGVQLVQGAMPVIEGHTYKLIFDASAEAARSMKVAVTAPDRGYVRYLPDQVIQLTPEVQRYEFEFVMQQQSDANGRIEFNMGAVESIEDIHLTNVKLMDLGESNKSSIKSVLSNGNYLYNGKFQEGDGRLGEWNVSDDFDTAEVTQLEDGRRLHLITGQTPATISQDKLGLVAGVPYVLSIDAETASATDIIIKINGSEQIISLSPEKNQYQFPFTIEQVAEGSDFQLQVAENQDIFIDNLIIQEDRLIKNGHFDNDFAAYQVFVDQSASAQYVVDKLSEDNAADFKIYHTGDQAWKIQLMQDGVSLKQGKTYTLSFKAKSDIPRKIMVAIQRNGANDDDWTAYSGETIWNLQDDYQEFSIEFSMESASDPNARLSISLGAVDNQMIDTEHRVVIDDIVLEEQ